MSLTKKSKLSLLLILISAVFSYLVVYPLGFPKFGLSFSLAAFAIIAYKLKNNKTKNTKYLLLFTILFALFIFIRSEEFLTFLNILATLYFGSLMILSSEKSEMSALKVVSAPFRLIFKSLTGKNVYRLEYKTPSYFQSTKLNLTDAAITLAISFFVLLIIPPLLASANPIFAGWLKDIVEMFSLNFLLEFMRTLN